MGVAPPTGANRVDGFVIELCLLLATFFIIIVSTYKFLKAVAFCANSFGVNHPRFFVLVDYCLTN